MNNSDSIPSRPLPSFSPLRLVAKRDDSKVVSIRPGNVAQLIERQAALNPSATALVDGQNQVSYAQLSSRSNQLARYLRGKGLKAGSVVGILLSRGLDFPIAALAILKSGCAYLPLDINAPAERLKAMLGGARVSMAVTQSNFRALLNFDASRVIVLDDCENEIGLCSTEKTAIDIVPEELAYVIYTSGSTGVPKAVAVKHGNLLNLIQWHNRAFAVSRDDVATQIASLGFDAAVWEIWPHLAAGATVQVIPDDVRLDPEKLRDWLVSQKVTISFLPTPLAEKVIKLPWSQRTRLRFMLTGADTLRVYPPKGLPFQLVNNYGPTECTVVATSGIVPAEEHRALPTIGRPIDGVEVHILDEKLKPTQVGRLGEIYIGGASVAQGYLNDAALTTERFVHDPFSQVEGRRLYRTGDLGCYLPDGQIAFHGRLDDQVKVRGYRIELNEVIGALCRHPAVRESVVIAGEDSQGQAILIAYVVLTGPSITVSDLRSFLAEELPDYMLPSKFLRIDALPIGSTGKVNRSALPLPNDENLLRDESLVEARTPTEERVSEIVSSLLGLEAVGVNENFFYLGGNSLFGTQVIARLRDAFGIDVPLLHLFDYPTVAGLAVEVERLLEEKVESMSEDEAEKLLSMNVEQTEI